MPYPGSIVLPKTVVLAKLPMLQVEITNGNGDLSQVIICLV